MAQERNKRSRTAPSRLFARGAAVAFGTLTLALPTSALAAPGSETNVTVTNDPLVVYAIVGLLLGAVALALFAARPRRAGLGRKPPSPRPVGPAAGLPWMPGGNIFGDGGEPLAAGSAAPSVSAPVAAPIRTPPQVANPWSTGVPGAPPRWGSHAGTRTDPRR